MAGGGGGGRIYDTHYAGKGSTGKALTAAGDMKTRSPSWFVKIFMPPSDNIKLAAVLCLNGLMGWVIGTSARNLTWQTIVEVGQVLSGKIVYPASDIPLYAMLSRPWTLCGQLCGVLLNRGLSAADVSFVVAGVAGALALIALGLFFYTTISRHLPLSILIPYFIYKSNYIGYGVSYGIIFMGTEQANGRIAQSIVIIICSLFAGGYYRFALFLLGASFGIHATFAVFFCGVLTVVFYVFRKEFPPVRSLAAPFLIGLAISAVSYLYQKIYFGAPLPPGPHSIDEYTAAYITNWDYHRRPYNFFSPGFFVASLAGIVSWLLLRRPRSYPLRVRIVISVIAVSFCASTALALFSHLPATFLTRLHAAMPGRFTNFNNFIHITFLLAFLAFLKDDSLSRKALFSIFVLLSLIVAVPAELEALTYLQAVYMRAGLAIAFSFLFIILLSYRQKIEPYLVPHKKGVAFIYRASVAGLCALIFITFPVYAGSAVGVSNMTVSDPVLIKASEGKGLLLVSDNFNIVSMKICRPVLLYPDALNGLPYSPEIGYRMNVVLKRIYGCDIFVPPPKRYREKAINPELYKGLWERRDPGEWAKIRSEFGVSQILTSAGFHLKLPVVIRSDEYCLYEIPAN